MSSMSVPAVKQHFGDSYIPQGYPDEWFPSVSATIGDRYPERSVFMLFIALTSGMRRKDNSQGLC